VSDPAAVLGAIANAFGRAPAGHELPAPIGLLYFEHLSERQYQLLDLLRVWVDLTKPRMAIIVFPAASGAGKTHMLSVIAARGKVPGHTNWAQAPQDREWAAAYTDLVASGAEVPLATTLGITMTFNFMQQQEDELERGSSGSTLLACRVLYSYFFRDPEQRVTYGQLLRFLQRTNCLGPDLTLEAALHVVVLDYQRERGQKPAAVILAVDELLMCEALGQGRARSVLQALSTAMDNVSLPRLLVVVSSLTPQLELLSNTDSGRPLHRVTLPPLTSAALPRPRNPPAHLEALLKHPTYKSLWDDAAGVPRLLEFICRHAQVHIRPSARHIPREVVLTELVRDPSIQKIGRNDVLRRSALESVFLCRWTRDTGRLVQRLCDLMLVGAVHLTGGGELPPAEAPSADRFFIPPLFFHAWDGRLKHPLLTAAMNFLYYDDPTKYAPDRFEQQMAALLCLLHVSEYLYRQPVSPAAEDLSDLRGVPAQTWTVSELLACDSVEAVGCCADPLVVGELSVRQALQLEPLDRFLQPPLSKPFSKGADLEADQPDGVVLPDALNNPGFDVKCTHLVAASKKPFHLLVELKFSAQDIGTYLKPDELVHKVVATFEAYPSLMPAVRERRLCFVLASFQKLGQDHTPMTVASQVHKKLSAGTSGAVVPAAQDIAACLLLLRRQHLEVLLTPTLRSRYQFLRAVDRPKELAIRRDLFQLSRELSSGGGDSAASPAAMSGKRAAEEPGEHPSSKPRL
jgi:hypothetical protein